MPNPRATFTMLMALALSANTPPALGASPAEIATQRQEALEQILKSDTAYTVAAGRKLCASGKMPSFISEQRAAGAVFYPDAADMCVATLVRTTRDGRLSELYVKLLADAGGDRNAAEGLPTAIGSAVLANQKTAPIGNGKAIVVTQALAFDAGFAAANKDRAAKGGSADAGQLRTLAEACLRQQRDAGTCFSAGYMYGSQAVRGQVNYAR